MGKVCERVKLIGPGQYQLPVVYQSGENFEELVQNYVTKAISNAQPAMCPDHRLSNSPQDCSRAIF